MWDAGDAREHVGQPGQRIDIVELCRRNERGHGGCPGRAAFGTGEEPRFSSPLSARSAALFVRQILPSSRKPVKRSQRLNR